MQRGMRFSLMGAAAAVLFLAVALAAQAASGGVGALVRAASPVNLEVTRTADGARIELRL